MTAPLPNFSIDLTGQTAIVTGASSGLGLRFAKVLAAAGAKVALTARRVERLEELAAEIRKAGGTAAPFALDVTDAGQLKAIVPQVEAELGVPTILVNNAGIPDAQWATKMSTDLIDGVLDTNVRAPWILSCEVARRLIEVNSPGRIVNISSAGAFNYRGQGAALYSVSKAAVIRMTEALAVEWARFNINVNAIAPGAFASEMMDGMLSRMGDITKGFPRGRLGDPSQLDSSLLYFCSPSSDFVTGTYVRVDDGQHPR
ncbi:SDR family NAD(P)-dependent oxidoreductase [Minwuia thermotolerans]|uniref:Short-chain dehydrogenase n=1 Tax=Minwuia thermotolerans TaxID=2056226 RepID=A0A2M9FXI8_9PROT|nr:SDR family NAD(P)-dependent oxidoreductase [Minwuia thermotolerans]PJK28182.1 short-chain dehydrogenase [Minwuia thermotolerans]